MKCHKFHMALFWFLCRLQHTQGQHNYPEGELHIYTEQKIVHLHWKYKNIKSAPYWLRALQCTTWLPHLCCCDHSRSLPGQGEVRNLCCPAVKRQVQAAVQWAKKELHINEAAHSWVVFRFLPVRETMECFPLYGLVLMVLVAKSQDTGESIGPFFSLPPSSTPTVLSCNCFMSQRLQS